MNFLREVKFSSPAKGVKSLYGSGIIITRVNQFVSWNMPVSFFHFSVFCWGILLLGCQSPNAPIQEKPTQKERIPQEEESDPTPREGSWLRHASRFYGNANQSIQLKLHYGSYYSSTQYFQGWIQTPNGRLGILGNWKNADEDTLKLVAIDWESRLFEPQIMDHWTGIPGGDSILTLYNEKSETPIKLLQNHIKYHYQIDTIRDSTRLQLWNGSQQTKQTLWFERASDFTYEAFLKDINCDGWPDFCMVTNCMRFSCGTVGFYDPNKDIFDFGDLEYQYPNSYHNPGFCYVEQSSINSIPFNSEILVSIGNKFNRLKKETTWNDVAVIEEDTLFLYKNFKIINHYNPKIKDAPSDTLYFTFGNRRAFFIGPEVDSIYQYGEDVGYPFYRWDRKKKTLKSIPWNGKG